MANAVSLARVASMVTVAAAASLSRTAMSARPVRDARRLRAATHREEQPDEARLVLDPALAEVDALPQHRRADLVRARTRGSSESLRK